MLKKILSKLNVARIFVRKNIIIKQKLFVKQWNTIV